MVCTWKFSMLFGKCCQSREVTRTKSRRRIVRGDKFYLPYSSFSAPGSPRFANGLDDDESSATATSNSYHAVHGEEAVAEPVESAPETPIVKSTAELVSNALDPPVVMTVEEPGTANETKSVQVDDAAQAKKPLQKDDGQHLTIAANTAFPTDAPTVPEKDDWMPRTVTANTAFPADALTTSTPEAPQTSFSEAKRADWLQNSRKQYEERMASAALKQRQRQEEAEAACFSDVDQPHRGDGLGPTLARIVGFGGEQHVASDPEVYQALARSRWQSSTHEVGLQTKVLGTWQEEPNQRLPMLQARAVQAPCPL